jgi:preprotein translocase subunit SecF
MIDWMKYRKIYFAISGILIAVGIYSLINWGLKLGVDFTGGAVLEYRIKDDFSTEKINEALQKEDYELSSVQSTAEHTYLFRFPPLQASDEVKITSIIDENTEGEVDKLRFETVGPAIGPELVTKTIYAIALASFGILLWVAIQFKSLKFGTSAVIAMLHDSFILISSFSLLSKFASAEVDFLLVTALLTTLSFSVHDTIVVYDRIRESQKKYGGEIYDLANRALTETMVRSLNNSFTIAFMLLALVLLGGITVRWFAAALLIGTILGTYSSPFVAVPLLVTWEEVEKRFKK